MSSETDQPRQRTVAELLAAHGDVSATGGRRRRRRAEDSDGDAPPRPFGGDERPYGADARAPESPFGADPRSFDGPFDADARVPFGADSAPGSYGGSRFGDLDALDTPVPDRSVLREPVPPEMSRPSRFDAPRRDLPPAPPPVERPTERIPRIVEKSPFEAAAPPRALRKPTDDPPTVRTEPAQDDDAPTMLGAPLLGGRGGRRRAPDDDGGPATQAAMPLDFDDRDGYDDRELVDQDYDDEYDADELDDLREDLDDEDGRRFRRRSRPRGEGQGWAAIVAQWIIGAIGGAALWVAFRFLWRDLPVVAGAAAVLVTVGLVLLVRQLLRSTDRKTTIFAVLVGLLLTVSPVILLLMGK